MMTPEAALVLYRQGQDAVVQALLEQSATVKTLQQQVVELKRQVAMLSKNSTNSSKRPSSDDLTKPPAQRRQKGKRKLGAQPGHPPHERKPFAPEEIDAFYDYHPDRCPDCGGPLAPSDGAPKVIQQVELPPIVVTKEEHRAHAGWCERCQQIHYATFPPEVEKGGLFKERLTALVAYMKHAHHASFSTIRKFPRDVLGLHVCRGYLCKLIQKVSIALRQPYEELLARLPLEDVLNVDETGHKENGQHFWTWVFRADLYILFKIDASRGSQVLIDVLGEQFDGVIGCDYFSAYRKHGEAFFRFITTPGLDPTNNAAEQALRFVIIDRFVTQGTRSPRGRTACERLWTVLATCGLQGRSAFEFILESVRASFYNRPAPTLLPVPPP